MDPQIQNRGAPPGRPLVVLLLGLALLVGCGKDPDTDTAGGPAPETRPIVLPDFSGPAGVRLRREVARADAAGMNPDVFAKVGDSNTEWPQNIYGLGCRTVDYGANGNLEAVVDRYSKVKFSRLVSIPGCSPVNSLTRRSAATVSGVWTEWLMTPTAELPATGITPPTGECRPRQTPLDCEIGLLSPRWVLIMSGTNDALLGMPLGETYRNLLARMIDRVRALGPVPVLSTLPPMSTATQNGQSGDERVAEANRIIEEVASRRQVPLIDLFAALDGPEMVGRGLGPDGLHLGVYGGEDQPDILRGSAVLSATALSYGANLRNLIWLRALNRLDRAAEVAG